MNKPLTFLFSLTFLFLFSGSVYGEEPEVIRLYWNKEKLMSEVPSINGKRDGLETSWYFSGQKSGTIDWKKGKRDGVAKGWYKSGRKKYLRHYKNGIENGMRKNWDEDGKLTFEGNFVDGVEEIK